MALRAGRRFPYWTLGPGSLLKRYSANLDVARTSLTGRGALLSRKCSLNGSVRVVVVEDVLGDLGGNMFAGMAVDIEAAMAGMVDGEIKQK
ncbi:hypothetical protein CLAIMM_04112 [Cladophialophora immunda]|nr:hypothetical protein CLAIMM_04112 [Cladophialophora immunda]